MINSIKRMHTAALTRGRKVRMRKRISEIFSMSDNQLDEAIIEAIQENDRRKRFTEYITSFMKMSPEQRQSEIDRLRDKHKMTVDERDFPCDQCEDGEMIAGFAQPNGQEPHTCNSCGYTISFP